MSFAGLFQPRPFYGPMIKQRLHKHQVQAHRCSGKLPWGSTFPVLKEQSPREAEISGQAILQSYRAALTATQKVKKSLQFIWQHLSSLPLAEMQAAKLQNQSSWREAAGVKAEGGISAVWPSALLSCATAGTRSSLLQCLSYGPTWLRIRHFCFSAKHFSPQLCARNHRRDLHHVTSSRQQLGFGFWFVFFFFNRLALF